MLCLGPICHPIVLLPAHCFSVVCFSTTNRVGRAPTWHEPTLSFMYIGTLAHPLVTTLFHNLKMFDATIIIALLNVTFSLDDVYQTYIVAEPITLVPSS